MMANVLLGALFVGPGSVVLANLMLRFPEDLLRRVSPRVVSFTGGAILGMVFLRLLSHNLGRWGATQVMPILLGGILTMFLLDRIGLLRHCHEFQCPQHVDMQPRMFLGNSSYALLSGLALAFAFQSGAGTGWILVMVLVVHEIPKSIVSLVLLKDGSGGGAALLWSLLPSLFTFLGALLAMAVMPLLGRLLPCGMGVGTAFFLYLALADLVPRQRRKTDFGDGCWQTALVLAGAALVIALPVH